MPDLTSDHIWPLLVAFLAALGCYTAVALVGGNGQLLEQLVVALGGALGGYATARARVEKTTDSEEEKTE